MKTPEDMLKSSLRCHGCWQKRLRFSNTLYWFSEAGSNLGNSIPPLLVPLGNFNVGQDLERGLRIPARKFSGASTRNKSEAPIGIKVNSVSSMERELLTHVGIWPAVRDPSV